MSGKQLALIAAPAIDPGTGRVTLTVEEGLTIQQMLDTYLPELLNYPKARLRVALVDDKGASVILPRYWSRVRPRAGVNIIVRVVPTGNDVIRPLLQIAIAVAAIALGQVWAAPLALGLGISAATATGLITLGVTLVGNLLVNTLFPAAGPTERIRNAEKPTYAISSWSNEMRPGGYVPTLLGSTRFSPPFAASSYTEIVGDLMYVRALFVLSYGPRTISDIRIGDTSIDKYTQVQTELREGYDTDLPLTLYDRQVVEIRYGVELLRELPRDLNGNTTGAPTVDQPVVRPTATDATAFAVIFGFPAGLIYVDDDGNDRSYAVSIRVRYRLQGETSWVLAETLTITASRREPIYRQFKYELPARGNYEIEITRLTDETTNAQVSDRIVLVALQTYRPEYPLNFEKPLALLAMRAQATYQLNGTLDTVNVHGATVCLDWDWETEEWVTRETRNPASLYRHALQGPETLRPVPDAQIDLDKLAVWHDFCRIRNLKYDRYHDFESSWQNVLRDIATAGRASVNHDGVKWGVIIDGQEDLMIVDHINSRNAKNIRWMRNYIETPDAFRVTFLDASSDYQTSERIVPWPGHTGDILITEQIEMPGKTDPDEIWMEARRRQYEIIHRPDRFTATMEGTARTATRGDRVMVSTDVISRYLMSARVKDVISDYIVTDTVLTMEEGVQYGIRFQYRDGDEINSVTRLVTTFNGDTQGLALSGEGVVPEIGSIIHFGHVLTESEDMIIAGVESGDNSMSIMHFVQRAPIIEELLANEVIPEWDRQFGAPPYVEPDDTPSIPQVRTIFSGIAGAGDPDGVRVLMIPGQSNTVEISTYHLRARLQGDSVWTEYSAPYVNGSIYFEDFAFGESIEFQVAAESIHGVMGGWSATLYLVVGTTDTAVPVQLPNTGIRVTGGMGRIDVIFATGPDQATKKVQVYSLIDGDTSPEPHALGTPIPVSYLATYGYTFGDGTTENLLANSTFDSDTLWTKGTGWSIAAGVAAKTAGTAASLSQAEALEADVAYRVGYNLTRTAGSIKFRLSGGVTTTDGVDFNSSQYVMDFVRNVTSNTTFELLGDAAFAGSLDNVVLFAETESCLQQGTYSIWFEPQNEDGTPGPRSGPYVVNVV